ncbi:MAG: hypothetical protein R3B06_20305 [Kofleriaceae bacterium]
MRSWWFAVFLVVGCGPGGSSSTGKPAGTPGDPVTVCERFGDVCRIDGSRLGVCTQDRSGKGWSCASQH